MKEHKLIAQHFKGIIDSTLREGFQFSKANFTLEEQIRIFHYLQKIGADYVEVGNPAKDEIKNMIVHLIGSRSGKPLRILSHIRNHEGDVQKAMDCGVDGVNILCTVDAERQSAMKSTPEEYRERLVRNILRARENRMEVRVGIEQFFDQPFGRSLDILELAERYRADRVSVADTLGKAMTWEVHQKIKFLRKRFSFDIEVHFHNDLGHSVSNAVASLQAGANWVSTSLLGIGERTGITPLSSLLVNLFMIDPPLVGKYDLSLLTEAENYISEICDIEMPVNLLTNTSNGFAHKAGIHLDAMMRFGPHKYEAFSPSVIGNSRNLVINTPVSGKTTERDVEFFRRKHG